jgi:hypothetical protein
MKKANEISLFATLVAWAMLIGGATYAHIVYFPAYLSGLPESNSLITGDYGLRDENFWLLLHPFAILSTTIALVLNWKMAMRRKFILIPAIIYALAIVSTAIYFVPNLMEFANSGNVTNVDRSEWLQRGQTWQHLSWIRGFFLSVGFVLLLIGLTKRNEARTEPAAKSILNS